MRKILFVLISLFVIAQLLAQVTLNGVKVNGVEIGGVGTSVVLVSISISPTNPVIPYNASISFTAQGTYSDGSQNNITGVAAWFSSNNTIASNNGATFQCLQRGIVTVSAVLSSVTGTTTLGCQSPTFVPTGAISTVQSATAVTVQLFTGSNGQSPYTFSSSNLPSWLVLNNTGCAGIQHNCDLFGTPATVGTYNFNIQLTDNLGNTACTNPGCPISLTVNPSNAEDNLYCNSSEVVIGSPADPPSNPITVCNYTALAGSPLGGSSYIVNVCPVGQLDSTGVHDTGCQNAPQPSGNTVPTCYTTGGVYCSTVQAALNYIYSTAPSGPCGADIQIWPTINDSDPTSAQNVYNEPPVIPIGNINCGPDYGQPWWYIRTRKYANLPAPGNRISPAWAGINSIPGYPAYSQLPSCSGSTCTYMPKWRCEITTQTQCVAISSEMNTSTIGGIFSGLRIMGIMFAAPIGRDTTVDLYGNSVCHPPGYTGNCAPGYEGAVIEIGCNIEQNLNCTTMSGVQGNPPATPTGTGGQHNILDRIIVTGCDDPTMATCVDGAEGLVVLENGQHLSVIDSYLIGGFCMDGIGPCVDSKSVGGGNPQETLNDIGYKVVDNFVAAAGENIFFGGGTATSVEQGVEVRRNHMFKPLTWKADDPSFNSMIYDGWVNTPGTGYLAGGSGAMPGCNIEPPQLASGVQATCSATVTLGQITDIQILNHGSGYSMQYKSNNKTAPQGNVHLFFTDSNGIVYTTCGKNSQLSGDVTTFGTTDVQWADGNKFTTKLNGTQISINNVLYTVSSVNTKLDLTVSTNVPSSGSGTFPYNSTFPSRGDCVYIMNGVPDIKNLSELKTGDQVIWEGNIAEDVWVGQSDQDGFCFLITPKNPNNNAPLAAVQDVTYRYNFCRNVNHMLQIAGVEASQGGFLPQALTRISVHDNVADNVDGVYWTAGTSPVSGGIGTCWEIENVQVQSLATSLVTYNHNLCLSTLPTGFGATGASFMTVFYNLKGSPSLMTNINVYNNIGAGGVKNVAGHATGQANCLNNSCVDHSGKGPSEVSMRQVFLNSYEEPLSAGTFTQGQLHTIAVTTPGTCTTFPNVLTLTGGLGIGGVAATGLAQTVGGKFRTFVTDVGQGYSSTPVVTLSGGTCSVQPVATAYIVGAGLTQSQIGCFDHNIMPIQAWNSITAMTPYPTTQLDANNGCVTPAGGFNNTQPNSTTLYNLCNGTVGAPGTGPCSWADVRFTNLILDANNAELVGTTGDLHLTSTSLGHLAGNDGLDIGPNEDLVIGTQAGVPSQYTGISISGGVLQIPQ